MEAKQEKNGSFFKAMYKTRVKVTRGEMPILNLSVLFSLVALITAPWLVILGLLIALLMGYRINIDRNGLGFEDSFEQVFENGKRTVKRVFNDGE